MLTSEKRIGRYVLADPVGRGAMGVVYRAVDPLIHRTVAVKVLHASKGLSPRQLQIARERFSREAQSAGSLDHPNIVRIFDVGEETPSGEMYIVMEYLSGPSVESRIRDGDIPLAEGAEIIAQIASGLDAAHASGIIHRDIKPSNILLTGDGAAKLADFGITHVASSSLTQDMRELGTPAYMSPEQVNGKPLDARADLFSLGVVSYEILTGQKPFCGTDAVSTAYAIVHGQPVAASVARPALPKALDGVLARMLAKDPTERFGSGREFVEALRRCIPGEHRARSAVSAKSPRARRFVLPALALALAVVALVAMKLAEGEQGRSATPLPSSSTSKSPTRSPAPSPARTPARAAAVPAPAPAKPARVERASVPKSSVTVSLAHRIRGGTLVVSVDGKPVFNESFSKAKLALLQTTTWDTFTVPAGKHTLRARVQGENGKTYLSDAYDVELPSTKGTLLRITFRGDTLNVKTSAG